MVDAPAPQDTLLNRIARFVDSPAAGEAGEHAFERLALDAFAYQFERIAPYRRLCEGRGATPATLIRWHQVPPVPVRAFKSLELAAAPAVEVFRSSGTTGGARSVHHHPYPDLYRQVIDATFPYFCLDDFLGRSPPMLALVPSRDQVADSSLGFMIDHVLRRFGDDDSVYAFGEAGVETEKADAWVERRAADRRPALVLATSFALAQWLEARRASRTAERLPPGSAVFDTGGFKGRHRTLERGELAHLTEESLGVAPARIVREYGMTELTSQLYTRTLAGGDTDVFFSPPWVRVRLVDPETLTDVPAGEHGMVAVFDLANLGSAVHLLTEDVGVAEGGGLRLLGRASGAELRGCSLTVEELETDSSQSAC